MDSDHENDNEEDNYEDRWGGVGGQVLLVDASEEMWRPRHDPRAEEDVIPVTAVMVSCVELARRVMVDVPTHHLGIAIFGTSKNDDKGLENVIQLLSLKQLAVEDIKTLKQIAQNASEIKTKWGSVDKYNFSDALWQASRMFSSCKKKMSNQTVTILSCFKEPDAAMRRVILKKASDLHSLGIKINLVNVSDVPFSEDSFFIEFGSIISNQAQSDYEPPEPTISSEEILSQIHKISLAKSASARLKFCLGDDVQIGVGLYHLCKTKNLPKKVSLHRETNALVESTKSNLVTNESTSRPVLISELSMYQTYGNRKIELTHSELMQFRKFGGSPHMKLLGFKTANTLDMSKYYLKQSAFLYPDEVSVTGSTKLFKCLRDRCIKKNCIAICIIVPRWYTIPRLVALVPQERIVHNKHQKQSDGFHVIYLPYVDNFKEVITNESPEISCEQLECMRRIIKKLKLNDFEVDNFENPKLQTLYNAIEALALEESEPRAIEDSTIPNIEVQDNRIERFIDSFETLFGPFYIKKTTKRTRDPNDENGSTSRVKKPVETPDLEILTARLNNKAISKYTVEELKQILRWRNPPKLALTGLKKNELVELVNKHCTDMS